MCKRVTAYRASKILYNFLKSNQERIRAPFLIPANVCSNVPETLEVAGVDYRFVDIDAKTLCMDEQYVLNHAKEISGIVMVHTYGVESDFASFYRQLRAANPDILIVDDRCLCMPSFEPNTYDADLVLYSFSEKKQVNLGKGSMAYIGENVRYEESPIPAQSFLTEEEWKLNEGEVLATMDAAIAHKEKLNAIYRKELPKAIQLPDAYQHWRFNILVKNKEEILKALFDAGLFASSHYKALGEEPAPIAANLSAYVINLFNDSYYTEGQAKTCCEIIRSMCDVLCLMCMSKFKTPILLITFNRPEHTRRVLMEIRKQKPAQLYVCQDGARGENESDKTKCQEVRDVIKELVDWPCELHTLYQTQNLGCGPGPQTGITWFFENVEQGIIMEDDCLPHPDFFGYCEELLERYKDNPQVQFINSTLYHNRWKCEGSYGFSHYMVTGAWAAWRRTWQGFDLDLLDLNAWKFRKQVLRLTKNRAEANWWYFKVKEIQADKSKKSYWDYQMQIHLFRNKALTIHPKVNLISNIGFDAEGTHTTYNNGDGDRPVYPILPLTHPVATTIDYRIDVDCFGKRRSRGWLKDTLSFIKQLYKKRALL